MTEKRFEPDCNDCHANQYDYSLLNSRYEADIERDEIINWNKGADNVTLRGLEKIVEELNFKEMQLEHCRKGYEKLYEENEQLKKENKELRQYLGWQQMELEELEDIDKNVIR